MDIQAKLVRLFVPEARRLSIEDISRLQNRMTRPIGQDDPGRVQWHILALLPGVVFATGLLLVTVVVLLDKDLSFGSVQAMLFVGAIEVAAIAHLWRFRREARKAMNAIGFPTCVGCGYDLAGLQEGVPCPECGRGADR